MPALIYWSIPIFVGFIAIELALFAVRRNKPGYEYMGYETSDAAASIAMGLGNLIVSALWKTVSVGILFAVYEFRIFTIDITAWWAWALVILGDDFCYYWFHRFGHRVRMGWAAHVNHHSSQYFNYSTALRQSWTGPFLKVWFFLPLVLLGFHPVMVITAQAISLLYQFWVHTELIGKLPRPIEAVMNTPSHHRVHHGANAEYVDKNYAGIFIIWDRLFGSFTPEQAKVYYGLRKEFTSRNPIWIAFHEWSALLKHVRAAKHWKNKLLYFLMPPAWDPSDKDEPQLHLQSNDQ
jgi:sterol desaturase/sphingolipid hydroxylase (fatty acid hydroxylase superfamily)